MGLLCAVMSLTYVVNAQVENLVQGEYFPEDEITEVCAFSVIEQIMVLQFPEQCVLYLDFLETPQQLIEVFDDQGILVYSNTELKLNIVLKKYRKYSVKTTNSCGDELVLRTISTFPNTSRKSFVLPTKTYYAITKKLQYEDERTLFEFAKSSKDLNSIEKLFLIQEYYLDGDFSNLKEDIYELCPGLLGGIDDLTEWGRLGDFIKEYVYKEPDRNCMCKTAQPFANYGHKQGNIPIQINGYRAFSPEISYQNKEYKARKRFFYWRDTTTGAAKSQRVKQYMRGSHTKTEVAAFPESSSSSSPNQTSITFTMLCEDEFGISNDCMCPDRKLVVFADYATDVRAFADKVNCTSSGSGYAASAQVEDWAILTKNSKKTEIGIIDAGRIKVHDESYISHNPEFKIQVINVVAEGLKAYVQVTGGGKFDNQTIEDLKDALEGLLLTPPHSGGGNGVSSGLAYLIDNKSTTLELLPNDPTFVTVHSYSYHRLSGHTKWRAETWLKSSVGLAGYLKYKETAECCNENQYSYIIAGQKPSDYYNRLKGVNSFFRNAGFKDNFPNKYGYQVTDEHHYGDYSSNLCPPNFGLIQPITILPTNTTYSVRSVLTGELLKVEKTRTALEYRSIGNLVTLDNSFNSGIYYIELVINGNLQQIKIYKP